MNINKPFGQFDEEEQIAVTRDMANRWKTGLRLLQARKQARTAEERAAINTELAGLRGRIVPDTNTLLPGA